jgi:hypothetical protein
MTDFDFNHAGKRPAAFIPSLRWQMLRRKCTEAAFGLLIAGLFTLAFVVYPL